LLTQSKEIEKIIIIIIHTFFEVFKNWVASFFLVVDEFDKIQGMKSNSYTQQHLKDDQNLVPHNTFPGRRRETREMVFHQVGCSHNFGEINDASWVWWFHNFGESK
jgi:hypothetical protein